MMTRKYSLVIEGDADNYSAHVPELPTILVTMGLSQFESLRRAGDPEITIYGIHVAGEKGPRR